MGLRYTNPHESERKLKQIDRRLYTRWHDNWENLAVWYRPEGRAPYMIMRVCNDDNSFRPVDQRTYDHIRYLFWINRHIMQFMRDQSYRDEIDATRKDVDAYNKAEQFGREIYPAFDAFQRAHGQSYTAKPRAVVNGFSGGV